MEEITRQKAIEVLVEYITVYGNVWDYIADGFKGYNNYTNEELRNALESIYEDQKYILVV